jgi:hypothetical protein
LGLRWGEDDDAADIFHQKKMLLILFVRTEEARSRQVS